MSGVSDVRPYFRARMSTLSLREWDSPFEDQIPENIVDRSFQLTLGETTEVQDNQQDLVLTVPVNLNVYVKGYRRNAEGYDVAVTLLDSILDEVLKPTNRLTQSSIKNITTGNVALERLESSNDNIIRIRMRFNVMVIKSI